MKRKSKRLKLSDPASPQYAPQGGALAPQTRPDYSKTPINPRSGMLPAANTPFPSGSGATETSPAGNDTSGFESGISTAATGNSGTQIFGGYFSEEYLSNLRGRQAARMWDEMRRSEAQISMLLNAIMNPIKAANWEIEPVDAADQSATLHADLITQCLFEMIDFDTFKHEALTVVPFGFALMEVVHCVEHNDPKFGTFNGLRSLAFRSQKTIENWQLEAKTGRILGVNQYTYSDLGGNQFIPGQFLLVFTHLKEGDNYEGISALRPMLGAYKRKEMYLKLAAIGIERYAIGTPIGTVPKGKERTLEYDEFSKLLQNYTSHEQSYMIKPEGWTIEIQKGEFDASKIKELITFENTEFANAVVGNFLSLGMNGNASSLALGSNLLDFFTSGIQSYADLICSVVNRQLIPQLVQMNFGPQKAYPKLKVSGISDKAGKELAEVIKFLADARALDPDKPLKEHLRKLYKMPKPDDSTAVALPAIPAGASANYPKPNDPVVDPVTGKLKPYNPQQLIASEGKGFFSVQLADKKYVKRFDDNKDKLKELMKMQLAQLYSNLKSALKKKYASLSGSDKILAAKGLETPGLNAYKSALKDQLSEIASQSINEARKLVPSKKHIKLSGAYDALPAKVRKLVDAQASLIGETQASDLEKIVFFQFTSAATSEDDIDAIMFDVDGAVEDTLEGATGNGMSIDAAAGNAVAHVEQQSAMSFFFDDEVLDGIESFTFTNEDPVSEICQELAGTTFDPNDPDLDTYTPPLHHNCKSRLVPNLKGDEANPEIDRDGVSLSKKALQSMTLSELPKRKVKK